MRFRILLILVLCATLPTFACAKDKKKKDKNQPKQEQVAEPKAEEPKDEVPVITEECILNTSLFSESVKNKQYADALGPWKQVYENCPNYNKAIYNSGQKIIKWQISEAKTEEERTALKNQLMKLYDDRIKWFGDDPRYPKAYILGLKAVDYCDLFTEDETKATAYPWIKESVTTLGAYSQIPMIDLLADVSNRLYKSDPEKYDEQYVEDYQLATDLLTQISKDKTNENALAAKQYKDHIDQIFALSGAANCSKLDELYQPIVAANLDNLETLSKVVMLYKRMGCTESDVYFAAAEASHKLSPTEGSAVGCAKMCLKKKEYDDAVRYFEQAVELADDDYDKADYLFNIALIYSVNASTYSKSRDFARQALKYNSGMGKCYLLIGRLYASSKPYANDAKGKILNKTVYWVAVDKFQQAKQIDPTCVEEANKLISTYSRHFPSKEERFDLPAEFNSGSFTVGGWIGETTRVR